VLLILCFKAQDLNAPSIGLKHETLVKQENLRKFFQNHNCPSFICDLIPTYIEESDEHQLDYRLLASIAPEKISLTAKGIMLSLVPLAVMAGRVFGLAFQQQDLAQDVIPVSSIIAGLVTVWRLLRKLVLTFYKPRA
jgi:hypothetical protein